MSKTKLLPAREDLMPEIQRLFEAAAVAGLSARALAPYVGVTFKTLYNWRSGVKPQAAHLPRICEAVRKIALAFPTRDLTERDGVLVKTAYRGVAAAPLRSPSAKQREGEKQQAPAAGDKFQAQMKRVFSELEPKLSSAEKYDIFVANPGSWQGFIDVLALCRRHGITLPK